MQNLSLHLWPAFEWILWTSLQAAVLVMIILGIRALLKNRLGARLNYCLWLLLLVRLVLPWAPNSRFNIASILHKLLAGGTSPIHSGAASPAVGSRPVTAVTIPELWLSLLPLFWIAGALLLVACALCAAVVFRWRIRRARPVTDPAILALLLECRRSIAVRKAPPILITDAVQNPTLFGFLSPHPRSHDRPPTSSPEIIRRVPFLVRHARPAGTPGRLSPYAPNRLRTRRTPRLIPKKMAPTA